MGWALATCLLIGAVCALRVPILVFALIAFTVMLIYAVVSYSGGSTALQAVGWGFVFAAVLQTGYVLSYWLIYLLYSRRAAKDRVAPSGKMHSKYSRD